MWLAYTKLSKENSDIFKSSLLAFNSTFDLNKNHQTLSTIPYISSLGLLANEYQERCIGNISCTECGDLNFKHNIVGDKAAIVKLIIDILNLGNEKQKDLKKMIGRIYDKQRSAYVHNAILRHNEYENEFGKLK